MASVLSSAALALGELPQAPAGASSTVALDATGAAGSVPYRDERAGVRQAAPPLASGLGSILGVRSIRAPGGNPWPYFEAPAPGPARSIGAYAAGCLQGGEPLPLEGPGYQVMRPSRRRYFGHPELVAYVRALGQRVRASGSGVVLVGDLSQPRGGRAASGHASHQTGLDVDVWFWRPEKALQTSLSREEREQLDAPSVLAAEADVLDARWRDHTASVLRLAAADPRVDRVFVHPSIKRELCELPSSERGWLRKLRPWHGHDDHFHARLRCPAGDPSCKPQAALPPGDGCEQLGLWFSGESKPVRAAQLAAYKPRRRAGARWPLRCDQLL